MISSLLAVAFLLAPSADAQRKKPPPKKKPAATAKPAPKPKRPPKPKPSAPPPYTPTPTPAPPAPPTTPEPEPMPPEPGTIDSDSKTKPPKAEEGDVKPIETSAEMGLDIEKPKFPSLLDVELGLKGFQRHLAYEGDTFNILPDYDLVPGAPAVAMNVGIYPVRTASGSVAAGLTGNFEYGFLIGTTYRQPEPGPQQGTHSTTAMAYAIGARVNFNFGSNTIGVGGEYGAQTFKIDLPPPVPFVRAEVPAVDYRFIRPNAAVRFGLANRFALLGNLGYLYMLSAGEMVSARYFRGPITTASGFDINLGVGWAPIESAKNLELRPMIGWRRIAFDFDTDPNNMADPFVASGAHDDYFSASLMIGYRL